jgi:hypothetical protein
MRWIILVVLVVVISSVATVALQYVPASTSSQLDLYPRTSGTGASPKMPGLKPTAVLEGDQFFEFGTLPQQSTGKHAWTVRNEGPGDLELWMKESTCMCTLAKFKDGKGTTVKPGESTEIMLEYQTINSEGLYEKGATIGTNDPALPEFKLHVRGHVYPAVMTYPPGGMVNFLQISNDIEDHVQYVALFSKDRPETKILKVSASNPKEISAEVSDMTKKDAEQMNLEEGRTIAVHVKSGFPLGIFREEVILTTDHPLQPEVKLTVTGKMTGPIAMLPNVLVMHNADGKAGASGEVLLSVRNNRPTTFKVAKKPERLQVGVDPTPVKEGRYRLTVTIPPGTPAERIEDEIVLETDHPKAATMVVPVSIWIANPD